MGYSYEIQYKNGKDSAAADALSRVCGAEILCLAISSIESTLLDDIQKSWQLDSTLQHYIQQLPLGVVVPHFSWIHQQLRRKGKLVAGPDMDLRKKSC